jgi:glutathione peroxidase
MNYGVTFPMMDKVSVKHGCISILTQKSRMDYRTLKEWNFQKYLINEKGSWIK